LYLLDEILLQVAALVPLVVLLVLPLWAQVLLLVLEQVLLLLVRLHCFLNLLASFVALLTLHFF
jgi:hypothetical protein